MEINPLKVGFWKNKLGGYNSHGKGLTQMQVEAFQKLRPGDKLVLWDESKMKQTDNGKDLTLAVMREKAVPTQEQVVELP